MATTERDQLEYQLAMALRAPPFPSTAEAIEQREFRINRIRDRLAALPSVEPKLTGMAAGLSVIAVDRRLGTEYARPEPTYVDESMHAHDDDPMWRAYGESLL